MDINDLTSDDEAIILQNGLNSDFWSILVRNFTRWKELSMRELLSPNFPHKEYLSGKVKTLEDVMNFPTSRINRISKKKV
jgi:hypothetical protein